MSQPISLLSITALQEIQVDEELKLLPLNKSHTKRILEILEADKSIRRKVSVASRINSPIDIENEIEYYRNTTGLIRYTLLRASNPVGLVSFWREDGLFWGEVNLDNYGFGFFLDPNERGKGIITRSVQKIMDTAVKNMKVEQFIAFCEDNNKESVSVLAKLGFEPTDDTLVEPDNGWIERKYAKKLKERNRS